MSARRADLADTVFLFTTDVSTRRGVPHWSTAGEVLRVGDGSGMGSSIRRMNWLGYEPAALAAAETLTTQQLYQGIREIQVELAGRKKSAVAGEVEISV